MSQAAGEPVSTRPAGWRGSIATRLLAILSLVTVVLTLVASVYEYSNEQTAMRDHLLSFGRSLARQGALALPDAVIATDQLALEPFVADFVGGENFVVLAAVVRADGKVLACSPGDGLGLWADSTLRIEAPILLERGGEKLGTFVLGISMLPMRAELRAKWARMFTRTSVGFLVVALLFWLALRTMVLKPLRQLDTEAHRLGCGELDKPVPSLGGSELGRLAGTMEEMRSNLLLSHRSLARQNSKLLELDRLKTQFLTNVSHEMRTPLTSILGGIELLMGNCEREEGRLTSDAVQRNGEQLLDLVDRLLDMAKLQDGNLLVEARPCRPSRILADLVGRFALAAQAKGLMLTCELSGIADVELSTDPSRLRQVTAALLDNAVKFTGEGSVHVVASLLGEGADQRLKVVVQDTGPGVAAEYLPRLFEPFSQEDGSLTREHGGSGLGLTMARRIAQCLGGDITITSGTGKGLRATIVIAVQPCSATKPQDSVPQADGERRRILVVDDARDNQRLLQMMLTKAGFDVELAANGRDAVAAVEASVASAAGAFDLVLMDLQMPVLDGVSAIRLLRERNHHLPIVALTAHALAHDRQNCLDAGADAYETKPISGKRLLEVVRTQLAPAAS